MTTNRAVVAAVLTALAFALLPLEVAEAKKPGGTTVRHDDYDVTLVIAVDLYAAKDLRTAPDGTPLDEHWKSIVERTWGEAFDRLVYECYKLTLELDFRLRDINADARDGRHRIYVGTGAHEWEGVGWDGADETTRNPKTGDGTRSYEGDRQGDIPYDAPDVVVAHEFGHIFGLGDDRANGAAENGRDGTLMVGGATGGVDPGQPFDPNMIDKQLIDRIGHEIENALDARGQKPLKPCETWKGRVRGTLQTQGCSPVSQSGTITVAVKDDGTFTGNGTTNAGAYTCDNGASIPPMSRSYAITGTKTEDAFSLVFADGVQLEAPIDGKVARATQDTGAGTVTVTLKCTDCREERVS